MSGWRIARRHQLPDGRLPSWVWHEVLRNGKRRRALEEQRRAARAARRARLLEGIGWARLAGWIHAPSGARKG